MSRAWARRGVVVALASCSCGMLLMACGGRQPVSATTTSRPLASSAVDVASTVVNIVGHVMGGLIAGTGMIIRSDGIVLTNNHVVAGTTGLVAQVAGEGPVYAATVIGVDPTHDVAVVRMEGASHLPTVPINISGVVAEGDTVTGMGNAQGHNGSPVSATGTITSLDETEVVTGDEGRLVETLNGLIQFNAPIQPGDSGGPLLDGSRVIGMDTAGSDPTAAGSSAGSSGAAIPIGRALDIATQIMSGVISAYIQSGHDGTLGVSVVDAPGGARVATVDAAEAGAAAGLVTGDVITEVDGVPVPSAAVFDQLMEDRRPGDTVTVAWRDRAGNDHQAQAQLSPGPPA